MCPIGYFMFEENCYKLFRDELKMGEADMECLDEQGQLAEPRTFVQVRCQITEASVEDVKKQSSLVSELFRRLSS